MKVRRRGEWSNDELGIRPEMLGSAEALEALPLTEKETREERKRLREKLARRYPLGFRPQEERP